MDEPRGIPRVKPAEKGKNQRLKQLGNAVVPQVVARIGRAILHAIHEESNNASK